MRVDLSKSFRVGVDICGAVAGGWFFWVELCSVSEDQEWVAHELWAFAGLITLGQFSPGPDMVLLTRTALKEGRAAGWQMALGIACGLMVHATVAVAGVATAYQRFPVLRQVLQWLAACYLIGLAVGMLRSFWRHPATLPNEDGGAAVDGRSPMMRGLLCNVLNPKVALFLAAVCSPFLAEFHSLGRVCAIWGMVVGLGLWWWWLWVWWLQWPPVRRFYQSGARWIDLLFGVALLMLAVRLMMI